MGKEQQCGQVFIGYTKNKVKAMDVQENRKDIKILIVALFHNPIALF